MGKKPSVFYFYRNGERVGTMVVYGHVEEFVKVLDKGPFSPWRLFDKVNNKYFFVWNLGVEKNE